MTRCLAVLKDMAGLSDDVKIQAADVFKDPLNREIFLGYETRLHALWLTKEVNKLGALPNASKFVAIHLFLYCLLDHFSIALVVPDLHLLVLMKEILTYEVTVYISVLKHRRMNCSSEGFYVYI